MEPRNPIFGKNRISQWFGYFCYPALVQDRGNSRITQKSYFLEKSDFFEHLGWECGEGITG
jgi:hypothetical protein